MARAERRLQHHGISRGQLLDAGESVFGRKGYHDTTLKEVAELAGFAVGSVYSFFENKDDLFRSIFLRRGDEFMVAMRELCAQERPPLDQLRAMVDFQVEFFRRHPDFARLTVRYANVASLGAAAELTTTITDNYQESMRLQGAIFERGQREGVFRPGDPHSLASILSGMVFSYQVLDTEDGRLPLESLHQLIQGAFRA